MQWLLIFSLILAVLAVVFAVFNTQPVDVNFLFGKVENVPLAAGLLIAMLIGAIVSLLFSTPSMAKSKWANRNNRKKITELEASLSDQKAQLAAAQQKIQELEKGPAEAKQAATPGAAQVASPGAATESPSAPEPILPTTQ